jgi:DNA-binding phage protein
MTKPAIIKEVKTVTRFKGLGRTARAVGVSRSHLSYVMHGKRKAGKKLTAKLKALGVEVPEVVEGGAE